MKIDKQLPVTSVPDTQPRPQARPAVSVSPRPLANATSTAVKPLADQLLGKAAGFNLQLNQQLSAMQLADDYLGELAEKLTASKLAISRQLSTTQATPGKEKTTEAVNAVNDLLQQRGERSGNSVDASFNLQLNEPLRSTATLQGLDSIEKIQRSGKETLLISAGSALSEPVAVVLNDGMTQEQVLRRFNQSLAPAGMRAELDKEGALKFSAPEPIWRKVQSQLKIQGEGKLFEAGKLNPLPSFEDGLIRLEADLDSSAPRELRQLLNTVVSSLDRIAMLREQINRRQADVREFLARQESQDEKQWAHAFAGAVFSLDGHTASSYAVVSRTVLAQANVTRFAVVSLLS